MFIGGGTPDGGLMERQYPTFTGLITNLNSNFIATNGSGPGPGLILSGSTLYGTTIQGGIYTAANTYGLGTVFALNTNGTGFTLLHRFAGGVGDGSTPHDPLLVSGNTLYGTTQYGGCRNSGTIFSISFQPRLTINPYGTNVVLTSPTNYAGFDYTGFRLQSTTNVASSVWTTDPPAPVMVNGMNTVTNPISGTQLFLRLINNSDGGQ